MSEPIIDKLEAENARLKAEVAELRNAVAYFKAIDRATSNKIDCMGDCEVVKIREDCGWFDAVTDSHDDARCKHPDNKTVIGCEDYCGDLECPILRLTTGGSAE